MYDDQERLMVVENYRDGVQHGVTTWYYPSGAKFQEVHFVNGRASGTQTMWFEDGVVARTIEFVDGIEHGDQIIYYSSGRKYTDAQNVRGKLEGKCNVYLPDGRCCNVLTYVNGEMVSDQQLITATPEEFQKAIERSQFGHDLKAHWPNVPAQAVSTEVDGAADDGEDEKSQRSDAAVAFEDKRYQVFTDVVSWNAAKEKCEKLGGRLAIVTSEEQNQRLTELVTKAGLKEAWLGATDEQSEGTWLWIDGSGLEYTNWNSGQPNNKGDGEHYLLILADHGGVWTDQPNVSTQHKPGYVCESE
jgi:antitoxin component YwqK of YwqJK toxin-antitoxin module